MPDHNLRGQSIEYLLKRVIGLSSVGDPEQVRSIMAVVARCTICQYFERYCTQLCGRGI